MAHGYGLANSDNTIYSFVTLAIRFIVAALTQGYSYDVGDLKV
jgi:hypothetical protein